MTVRAGPAQNAMADQAFFRTARPRLVISNEALKQTFAIQKTTFIIGRKNRGEEAADCVLAHDAVSGQHAKITFANKRFFITDLESKNFTFLGKEMLPPNSARELKPNTHVRIGSVDALFIVDVDAEGRATDVKQAETALILLEREGRLTRNQRERVLATAAERNLNLGEALLLEGLAGAERWVDALERARLVEAVIDTSGGAKGGSKKLVVAIVVVLAAAALSLAIPAVRQAVGRLFG